MNATKNRKVNNSVGKEISLEKFRPILVLPAHRPSAIPPELPYQFALRIHSQLNLIIAASFFIVGFLISSLL